MSHVKHYDILTGSIAAVFAGAIAMLANFAGGAMMGGNKDGKIETYFSISASYNYAYSCYNNSNEYIQK